MKRVNSQLETITENGLAEEDNVAVSQGQQQMLHGQFDIEASHSFSLRTYGKDKASAQLIESLRQEGGGADVTGKDSVMSNYSRIQADSQHRWSQRDRVAQANTLSKKASNSSSTKLIPRAGVLPPANTG